MIRKCGWCGCGSGCWHLPSLAGQSFAVAVAVAVAVVGVFGERRFPVVSAVVCHFVVCKEGRGESAIGKQRYARVTCQHTELNRIDSIEDKPR